MLLHEAQNLTLSYKSASQTCEQMPYSTLKWEKNVSHQESRGSFYFCLCFKHVSLHGSQTITSCLWKEQKHLNELIICAAWLAGNQYLAPTLGQQDGRDRVILHRANYHLMKACPGLRCKLNQCKEEVLCLSCWIKPLLNTNTLLIVKPDQDIPDMETAASGSSANGAYFLHGFVSV